MDSRSAAVPAAVRRASSPAAPRARRPRDSRQDAGATLSGNTGLAELVGAADDQDHARPQGCDILVVVLESGNGGVIGVGNRIQGLAGLDLVMDYSTG